MPAGPMISIPPSRKEGDDSYSLYWKPGASTWALSRRRISPIDQTTTTSQYRHSLSRFPRQSRSDQADSGGQLQALSRRDNNHGLLQRHGRASCISPDHGSYQKYVGWRSAQEHQFHSDEIKLIRQFKTTVNASSRPSIRCAPSATPTLSGMGPSYYTPELRLDSQQPSMRGMPDWGTPSPR